MIVEFIGTPGSGKSTIVPKLVDYLRGYQLNALPLKEIGHLYAERSLLGSIAYRLLPGRLRFRAARRLAYYESIIDRLIFSNKHPRLVKHVVGSQTDRPPEAEVRRRRILQQFYRLIGYYQLFNSYSRSDDVLVLDEGLVHKVVQLTVSYVETPDHRKVQGYLDCLPHSKLVVYVRAPLDLCLERVLERGIWKHARGKSEEEIAVFIKNAQASVALAVEHLRKTGWNVVEAYAGLADPAPAVDALQAQVSDVLLNSINVGPRKVPAY